jgi:Zn-dependent protease with chaperone function
MKTHEMLNRKIIVMLISTLFFVQQGSIACATEKNAELPQEDSTIVPTAVSDAIADMEMRIKLATKANALPCQAQHCEDNAAFDQRIQHLLQHQVATAYVEYPALRQAMPNFEAQVIEKSEFGTASNSRGKLLFFRGLQTLHLSDDALSFIIAREMGHVIGKHHNKNTGTKLLISALATVLFPAVGIIAASSTAQQASTATTLVTSAGSTFTSLVGGEVAVARMKPTQLQQADDIALKLMRAQGVDLANLLLDLPAEKENPNSWLEDLAATKRYLQVKVKADAETAEVYQMPPAFVAQ